MTLKNYCIIPIRSKSKGIKNKNIVKINKIPLILYSLSACLKSNIFEKIFIATDSKKYIKILQRYTKKYNNKIIFFLRDKKNALDKTPSEKVLTEVIKKNNLKNCIIHFVQATSPLLLPKDIKIVNSFFKKDKKISVLCGYKIKKFIWNKEGSDFYPINYNLKKRKMRQDSEFNFVENGALYAFYSKNFIKFKNRLHEKILIHEMPENRSLEIDELRDLKKLKKKVKENKYYCNIINFYRK